MEAQDKCGRLLMLRGRRKNATRSALWRRLAWFPKAMLEKLRIDQKAEPERLKKEKDRTLFSIQKAKPNNVSVTKQQARSGERRQPVVQAFEATLALEGASEQVRSQRPPRRGVSQKVTHRGVRPAIVPAHPFPQRHPDIIHYRAAKLGRRTRHKKVLIVFTFLATPFATAREMRVLDRKHAAMPNRASKKAHQPWHVITVDM